MRFESDAWRKSSYSSAGECVEVAFAAEAVGVRDSKHPAPVLVVNHQEWAALCRSIAQA